MFNKLKNLYNNLKLLSNFNSGVLSKIIQDDFEDLAGMVLSIPNGVEVQDYIVLTSPTPNTVLVANIAHAHYPKTVKVTENMQFNLARKEVVFATRKLHSNMNPSTTAYFDNIISRYYGD